MIRCSRCGQQAARRSRRVGVTDHVLSVLHLYPFRCQLCTTRFRAFQGRHYTQHGSDQREYDRLLVKVPVVLTSRAGDADGTTIDLSVTGCAVRSEGSFEAGDTVRLRLQLGEAGDVTIESAVVRAEREGRVGLHFTRIAAPDRERLNRYLGRFLRPSGQPSRRSGRPRPELVMAAVVGAGVIFAIFFFMGHLGGGPLAR